MKKTISILFALALVLSALMVGSSPVSAWDGAATIRDETFYVPSSSLTLGALTTVWGGVQGYVIADPFQINMEYQAGILDKDIANINTYLFPANAAFPPDHTDGTWQKNFSDNTDYVLRVNPAGGLTVYTYPDSTETVPSIQWTLTGWHQTILAGDIIDHGDGTITLRVVPSGTYRPFPNDPPVNNVEIFSGQLQCEVLGYRFTGTPAGIGAGSSLVPILRGSASTAPAVGPGIAEFEASDGGIEELGAVAPPSLPSVSFPHGMFSFKVMGIAPGQTVTVTVTLPSAVPVGTVWWKYDNGRWSSLPNLNDNGDNIMKIKLTDGGTGDSDSIPGQITDPGGPGNPMTVGWDGSPTSKTGVLIPWLVLLGAIAVGAASLLILRRRRAQI